MAEGQGRFFPEQGNRQPPRGMERRGGNRLNVTGAPPVPGFRPGGVTATPDRPTAPTLPHPDTVQLPPEQAPQKPKKRHTGRNIALAGTALGVLGTGAYETYQNIPAFHQAVDSRFLDHLKGKSLSTEASVFDPQAASGVIKPSMIEQIPQGEIDKQFPTAFGKLREDGNNTILTIPQPISESERAKQEKAGVIIPDIQYEIREDKGTLQMQYPLDLSQSENPNAQISFTRSFAGFTATDKTDSFPKKGYYGSFEFQGVPKGTIIKAPVDGLFVVSRTNGVKHDPEHATNGFIDFKSPDGTMEYRLYIGGVIGNNIFVLKTLLDVPELNPDHTLGTFGVKVKKGQPLFQTDTKLDQLGFTLSGVKPDGKGSGKYVPSTIEWLTSPDNKLLDSQK